MKKLLFLCSFFYSVFSTAQSSVRWISSDSLRSWQTNTGAVWQTATGTSDAEVLLSKPQQTIEGFGTCFNELGWTSLGLLSASDREQILNELFVPGKGANFTICRMPIGANDFSRQWYSYNETAGDFEMKNFSIANDKETLIPFIKAAMKYNPSIKLWASPWSPPSWMKTNGHYAARAVNNADFVSEEWGMDLRKINNGLSPDKEGREGTDMFLQGESYFNAYALYFTRFIEAYRKEGINISMVMPQNEFNSAQVFPSCTWTAAGLVRFLRILGPKMDSMKVALFLGTIERANHLLADTVLTDGFCTPFIKGAGFQWAGKGAIAAIHKKFPNLQLYQTEQECGNSKNDWKYCRYAWDLMKLYLSNGANAYTYWNTSLKEGGISTWGWKQNSLVSVDTVKKTYKYNYEYYLIKHFSHFIQPGAKRLETSGDFSNLLAFQNPDRSVVVVVQNETKTVKKLSLKLADKRLKATLAADSFNSFLIKL